MPHTEAEFERIMGLRDKLFNANSAVYVAVLVWWIVWLWMDEPGTAANGEGSTVAALEASKASLADEPPQAAE
jgi:hypothetical protein